MQITIKAFWDEDAAVWVAIHDDLGIATDASSLDALNAKLNQMLPDAVELNGYDTQAGHVPFDLLIQHDHHAPA